jgi:hypothetical protein
VVRTYVYTPGAASFPVHISLYLPSRSLISMCAQVWNPEERGRLVKRAERLDETACADGKHINGTEAFFSKEDSRGLSGRVGVCGWKWAGALLCRSACGCSALARSGAAPPRSLVMLMKSIHITR